MDTESINEILKSVQNCSGLLLGKDGVLLDSDE